MGSGLLVLIISSGRDPLHGPATADRISWRVTRPLGSGLLILIISSGRDPVHGPAVADRISWSVLG